nr:axoneme-associated protein mst101(2) isoform X2 [Helicoverpa armigera]
MSTRIKLNVKNITTSFQNFSDVLGHESKIHNGFSCLVVPRSIPLRRPDCKYYKQDYVRRNNLDYARLALTPAPGSRSLKRIASDIPLPGKWLDTVHMIPGTPGRTRPWQSSYSFYYDKKNPQCPPPSPKVEVEEKEPDDPNVVDCTCPDPCPDTSGCSDAPRPQVLIILADTSSISLFWKTTLSSFYDTQSLYTLLTPKLNEDAKGFNKKAITCSYTLNVKTACEEVFKPKTSLFHRKKCNFVTPLNFYRHFSSKCSPKKGKGSGDSSKDSGGSSKGGKGIGCPAKIPQVKCGPEGSRKYSKVCGRSSKGSGRSSKGGKKGMGCPAKMPQVKCGSKGGKKGGKGSICPPQKKVKDCPPKGKGKRRGGKGSICPPQKKIKDCPPRGKGKSRGKGSVCGAQKKVKDCPPKGKGKKGGGRSTVCPKPKKAKGCLPKGKKGKGSGCVKQKIVNCPPKQTGSSSRPVCGAVARKKGKGGGSGDCRALLKPIHPKPKEDAKKSKCPPKGMPSPPKCK